jgi:hypothetical protein
MIFHEPGLADVDALALDDEAPLSANAQRLFEGAPRRPLASASGSEPDCGSGARNGRFPQLMSKRDPALPLRVRERQRATIVPCRTETVGRSRMRS